MKKYDSGKYKKMAKIIQFVVRIFFIVSVVSMTAAVVIGLFLSFTNPSALASIANSTGSMSFSVDNAIMFKVSPKLATIENLKPIYSSICFMAAAAAAVLVIIFRQLDLILETIKHEKPFELKNSRRLSIIGITLIIGSFVIRAGQYLVVSTMIHKLQLFDITVNFTADNNMILTGFIVMILAGVFRYGSFLQNEFDSTV